MIEDSKYVFNNENFIDFSDENLIRIESLFRIITDSINSFIPLNESEAYWTKIKDGKEERIYYKYMNDCISFALSPSDSTIMSKGEPLRAKMLKIINKVDTNNFNYIEVCNYGTGKKPRVEYRIKNEVVKGNYSFHLVSHMLSNYELYEPKNKIEDIAEELVKLKKISDDVVYKIGVSSEIGFFD